MPAPKTTKPPREELTANAAIGGPKMPPRLKFDIPLPDDNPQEFYAVGEWAELVIEDATDRQARDYTTKEPLFWKSGDPLMETVLTGVTTRDGIEQTLWISGRRMRDAYTAAIKAAGVGNIAKGDMLKFCNTGEEATAPQKGSRQKLSPTKQYAAELIIG